MASKLNRIGKDIMSAMKKATEHGTSAYDTTAEVRRIEGDIAWVHIAGGVDETPVKLTIAAKAGDSVQVRVGGGRAWITGNATAPPTDDRQANIATEKAEKADKKVVIAQEIADTAKKIADTAKRIAGNTTQYFWHTESGTDTGVHITEKPQEEFLDDPENGGGNLLMRSNGLAVRDGLTELATFGKDGVVMQSEDGVSWLDMRKSGNPTAVTYSTVDNWGGYQGDSFTVELAMTPAVGSTIVVRSGGRYANEGKTVDTTFTAGTAQTASCYVMVGRRVDWTINYDPTVGNGQFTFTLTGTTTDRKIFSNWAKYSVYGSAVDLGVFTFGSTRETPTGNGTMLIGRGLASSSNGQFVIGKYNVNDTNNNKAFIIGKGDENTPADALTVDWSGNIVASGGLTLNGDEPVADWVTEQGTNGSWKYRKWHSGKVEAWARWNVGDVACTIAASSFGGYRSGALSFAIPSGIFTTAPFAVGIKSYSQGAWLVSLMAASPTSISALYGCGISTTLHNQTIDVYAWQN